MPTGRLIGLCVGLFLASALISTTARSSHPSAQWPAIFTSSARKQRTAYSDVAFATFLASNPDSAAHLTANSTDLERDDADAKDGYYLGARVLTYQLLHSARARTNNSIPFLVIVTSDVQPHKRARLVADGATVVEVEKLNASWVHPGADRWRDVLSKLRLFQLTQYKKICFIDADMLVTERLDGVFDDPATDLLRTKQEPTYFRDDEATLPPSYMFAGKADAFGYDHDIPPRPSDYLNSGFYVFAPSVALFDYYISLLKIPDRFNPTFPEQNLFNYAHRRDGNMPWALLNWRWNMNWPTMRDMQAGAKSFHAKYWDDDSTHDQALKRTWEMQRAEMEGYYRGLGIGKGH